ncbi:ferredoxin [Halorientalis regularis]|jgi:ferredoxin|uniref:Ferredoxin n=1 Tax=Halorientalis regularis TaxID=660518 RepID=A0A1G7R4J8_9EURY|nr:ferredoxin [Halorientalis regularis]SDG05721.1 Ferredoxin [Halorientalis regularis]
MPEYTITLDRGACDGIFACLVRDDRFVEREDGLAGIEGEAADGTEPTEATVTATFDDDRLADAEQAAAACPVDAISVTEEGNL